MNFAKPTSKILSVFLNGLPLIVVFAFSGFISFTARAQKPTTFTEFNSILFSAGGQSWTARDQQIYFQVLSEIFKQKNLSPHASGADDDFILSRISQKEASLFDLSYEKVKISEAQLKKIGGGITREEVEKEAELIAKAMAILELKQNQHKDVDRFKAWVDLLKRKYLFKQKTGTS